MSVGHDGLMRRAIAALVRAREDDGTHITAALWAGLAGVLRFQGIPIGAVVVADRLRRDRDPRGNALVALLALGPPVANLVWTGVVGQGRRLAWYGLDLVDVEFAVSSVSAWISANGMPTLKDAIQPGWSIPWWSPVFALA